jgi:hypothetical protein
MSIILYKDRFISNSTPADVLLEGGAFRVFEGDISELNNLPQDRRKPGMICGILNGQSYYILNLGPWSYTDSDWEEIVVVRKSQEIYFVDKETPTGTVDDMNMIFELQHQPVADSEHVYINGILQTPGDTADYVIATNQIIFAEPPFPGANIRCTYRYVNV